MQSIIANSENEMLLGKPGGQLTDVCGASSLGKSICKLVLPQADGKEGGGTGWLYETDSDTGIWLLVTNFHVIPSLSQARQATACFQYEHGKMSSQHRLRDVARFFVGYQELDYAFIGISNKCFQDSSLVPFKNISACVPLQGASVRIVGHPRGRRLQYSQGKITQVHEDKRFFNHDGDTEPGSSGSPIFLLENYSFAVENNPIIGMHPGADRQSNSNRGISLHAILQRAMPTIQELMKEFATKFTPPPRPRLQSPTRHWLPSGPTAHGAPSQRSPARYIGPAQPYAPPAPTYGHVPVESPVGHCGVAFHQGPFANATGSPTVRAVSFRVTPSPLPPRTQTLYTATTAPARVGEPTYVQTHVLGPLNNLAQTYLPAQVYDQYIKAIADNALQRTQVVHDQARLDAMRMAWP